MRPRHRPPHRARSVDRSAIRAHSTCGRPGPAPAKSSEPHTIVTTPTSMSGVRDMTTPQSIRAVDATTTSAITQRTHRRLICATGRRPSPSEPERSQRKPRLREGFPASTRARRGSLRARLSPCSSRSRSSYSDKLITSPCLRPNGGLAPADVIHRPSTADRRNESTRSAGIGHPAAFGLLRSEGPSAFRGSDYVSRRAPSPLPSQPTPRRWVKKDHGRPGCLVDDAAAVKGSRS
jgi:hypothetical protein